MGILVDKLTEGTSAYHNGVHYGTLVNLRPYGTGFRATMKYVWGEEIEWGCDHGLLELPWDPEVVDPDHRCEFCEYIEGKLNESSARTQRQSD